MKHKYFQLTFWLYYLVFGLHFVASIFSILFPILPKAAEPTGLSTLWPLFFINIYTYFLVCGLIGFVAGYYKGETLPIFLRILLSSAICICFLIFFPAFYIFLFGFGASFISGLSTGRIPFVWCGLIGANIAVILQFFIFEYLKKKVLAES